MGAARINDPIKGFEYLVKALSVLKERYGEEDYFLVLFGGIKGMILFCLKYRFLMYGWDL